MADQRYLVAARKYRPQLFRELVAQEHVTETLKNAIRLERLAHAYLFSGPRGVGKTTAARILAKAINCTTPPEERAAAAEPCRVCDSCRAFEEGRSLSIIEIDAASNNKVEDIRDLRETVRVPPQGSRKKVYIVDEVHMLSNAAFNALLKTLEEPPPYVLFIFATTEPHKVLPTILSRCQRFDFRRIPVPEIVGQLRAICQAEGITADEASLLLIARKGDGALRDALSAFDQAVSLCGTSLVYGELAQALGVVDVDLFFEVTQHVQARDAAGMLRLVERIVRSGYDLLEFLGGLSEHLRNLIVARTMPDTDLIEAPLAVRHRYAELAQGFAEADLLRLLLVAGETEEALKSSMQPRLKLEMALLKMAGLGHAADLRETLARLERLEQSLQEGALPAQLAASEPSTSYAPAPPAPSQAPPEPEAPPETLETPSAERPSNVHLLHAAAGDEVEDAETSEAETAPDAPPPRADMPAPAPSSARDTDGKGEAHHDEARDSDEGLPPAPPAPPSTPRPLPPQPATSEPAPAASVPGLFGPPALRKKSPSGSTESSSTSGDLHAGDGAPALFAGSSALSTATAAAPAPLAAPALRRLEAAWPGYVQHVKSARIHVGAMLQLAKPLGVEDGILLLAVPDAFHERQLRNQRDFLARHLDEHMHGLAETIRFVVHEDETAGDHQAGDTSDPSSVLRRLREEHPVVRAIFDQFGGEIVW